MRRYKEELLVPVLNRDIFHDPTGRTARAALGLGLAHRKFDYFAPNVTPYGADIAAPPPRQRELVCRDGLKYYMRIPQKKILEAMTEVEKYRATLYRGTPQPRSAEILAVELDMAARMAVQSCKIMLRQHTLATGKNSKAKTMARKGIQELHDLQHEAYGPLRNKGTTTKCSAFLLWRTENYRRGILHFPPEELGPN